MERTENEKKAIALVVALIMAILAAIVWVVLGRKES